MCDKEEVIANLRAVCISRKGPATVSQLNRDYKELDGTAIPFRKLGFNTLEDFLRSEPTFTLTYHGGEIFVSVVPKKESQHITEMIAKQKSPKKRSRSARLPRELYARPETNKYSNLTPRRYVTNIARTSRSAQLYSGKPTVQTFSPIRARGRPCNYSSVNNNLMQNQLQPKFQPPVTKMASPPQMHSKMPQQQQIREVSSQSHSQQTKHHNEPAHKENIVPNLPSLKKEVQSNIVTNMLTSKNISNNKDTSGGPVPGDVLEKMFPTRPIRMPQMSENINKSVGKIDLSSNSKNCQEKNLISMKRDDPTLSDSKTVNNPSFDNKRSVINLETVTKTSRNVSVIGTNGTENIQVTMHNGCNSISMKSSAQDRLNRIRQNQCSSTNSNLSDTTQQIINLPVQTSIKKVSQQSRLLKYRNQDSATVVTNQPVEVNVEAESPIIDAVITDRNIDYEQMLYDYCMEKDISSPEIRILQHKITPNKKYKTDRPSEVFGCKIKVGDEYSYGSYSDKFINPEDASQAACKIALESLIRLYGSLEERDLPITESRLIPHRLLKIIAGHSNGKFVHQLPGDYREHYSENLPDDWLDCVKMSHLFRVDNSVAGSQIISLCQQQSLMELKSKTDHVDFADLSPMVLPEKDAYWNVLITNVCSTIEIWCRIIGQQYDSLYEELTSYMEQELTTKKVKAENVSIGGYYAVCSSESWYRIQVLEMKDEKALCFYIDTGEEDWHSKCEVHALEMKYRYVPPQAVLLQLSGLEEYAENKYALKHLEDHLLNKALVAELVPHEDEDQIIPVILYDTYTNEDINLNAALKKKIKDEAKAPRLNEKGRINDKICVSHISDNGDIYIQVKNDTFKYLLSQIQLVTDIGFASDMLRNTGKIYSDIPDKLYLAVKPDEFKCYRVTVTGSANKGQVPVFFVDYGFKGYVDVSRLIPLDKISNIIDEFPYQAMKVKLSGLDNFTPAIASRLRGCLPVNGAVLLKVIESKDIPVVEIFMRTQDQLLISVNNALQNELEIEKNAKEIERETVDKRIERLSFMPRASRSKPLPPSPEKKVRISKSLPEPNIPCDGSYFPVTVTMAASPSNFVVQPFKEENNDFKNLMKDLQLLCNNSPSASPPFEDIEKGNLYAGKHADGVWYRVQVTNVMRNNSVTVHFCDYGDYDVMSCKNLQKLTAPFLKMPYNAMRARLAGISPTLADWSVHDCLRFQELVCDKAFIAIVRSIDADELNASEKILSLTLIDTSTDKDIYITPDYLRTNNTL